MARPKKYKSAVRITLYLDSEMAKILSHIARERGVSRSQLVSELLFQHVSQYLSQRNETDETRSKMEKYIDRELSSIRSLVQGFIKYCKDSECVKELLGKYGEAIINKLASLEDLAIKHKVTTAIHEIEKIKQIINSYR
jgi:Ribbon-helix-helix protein, copG family.